jgi:hypothetical protein
MKVKTIVPFVWLGGYIAMAQMPGTFTPTGNLTTPRASHSATLLTNGKVLIAGGVSLGFPPSHLASAELYDPSTGTFTATGEMITARRAHTATLLADGRVLIAGGFAGPAPRESFDASAELYDPSTGKFVPTGGMTMLRGLHKSILLMDGRVIVTGCSIPCNSAIAELYDPGDGVFEAAAAPGAWGSTATLLADGKVLTTGGSCADRSEAAQLFDPATGIFSFTGRMQSCDNVYTATLLPNGKVLFAGNVDNDGSSGDAELYDFATGTFVGLGSTIWPHQFSAATLIPDGTVLITGGQLPGGKGHPGVEFYTPSTGTFGLSGRMNAARHSHTTSLLPDGTVLVAGGFSVYPGATDDAEIYRPSVLIPAPVLYSISRHGSGQGAIKHAGTAKIASLDYPAAVGEELEIYLTGLMDGSVIPPQVSIDGRMAEILSFGNAPGCAGLNQVNVRVPSGVASGPAVPVRLNYLKRSSNEVTISVQ